ncbi:MAG: hypothetical protein ACI8XB_001112 [Patiriisocius sp.]|jgi:hypothetical protein
MFSKVFKFLAVALILVMMSCGTNFPGYSKVEKGAFMKVLEVGNGEFSPVIGQHLSYQLRILNESKIEIYHTNKKGIDKLEHLYYTHNKSGVIQRNLSEFHEGDSLSFMLSAELLNEQFPEIKEPDNSKYFQVNLRIFHLEDDEDRKNRLESFFNYAKLNEDVLIDEYFSSNGKKAEFLFWKNLFIKTNTEATRKVKKNDPLMLKYKAFFLNGELFDEATDSSIIRFSFGESSQVIEGLLLVISKTGIGSNVEVIIPSSLAFGDEGSSSGIVPPNTPLRYEMEIMEDTTAEKY